MIQDADEWGFDTLAIRAGHVRTLENEHCEAIFPTSSYVFNSAAEAAARFMHQETGNVYSRFTNPTVRIFEQRLALLEGGERCIATASGMAAVLTLCLGILKAGDHILSAKQLFGSTVLLFNNILGKFGIQTTFVDLTDLSAWQNALRPETRLLFIETPSNPLTEIGDIRALATLAHQHNCLLVVDNCFCTPILQKPLALGADVVIHSATKYLDGQGRCIGGAIVGQEELLEKQVYPILRSGGATMSPFNAWIFLKGLETLNIRMKAHCQNARLMADWLAQHPKIEHVFYPGLDSHPQHQLAQHQQADFGGIVSFIVHGGQSAAWQVIDNTRLVSITANLGDVKTTITHPATTTHGRLSAEQRAQANIADGLIRLSIGLEDIADLKADLARGLESINSE